MNLGEICLLHLFYHCGFAAIFFCGFYDDEGRASDAVFAARSLACPIL